MKPEAYKIIKKSKGTGWIIEPLAKELLRVYGLKTTEFYWAKSESEALRGAAKIGFPLVAKVVSPEIIHKSDVGGVIVGVRDDSHLREVFHTFSRLRGFEGILLDRMESGIEIIIGSKDDPQFGTVILTGIGGTSVEIYRDVVIRIAPISAHSALNAINSLKGIELLTGHRGSKPINMNKLTNLIVRFSRMAHELHSEVTSIDLNPVLCNSRDSVIADARFILRG
jgi:hypothetical protein